MGTEGIKIKKRILIKIYTVWFIKRVLPLVLVQILLLGLAVKFFADNVFVSKVLQNAIHAGDAGYLDSLKYLGLAFLQTNSLNQIAILIGLGFGALLIRDFIRSLLTYKTMWLRK